MHIPDGYLSPSSCAALYAACGPFWYTALKRLRQTLHTRMVPLLSVFAAFSFVIMMFNLPLPGGTTGHAVGMAIAAIVLGPSAAIVAISIALLIQSVFFGDGGVTAIGANCFNMAVAGSLVSYAVYRLVSWRAALDSPRRIFAAGLAGYAAINCAALLAAIEFGLQPLWFHDAAGAPLYAPYPLRISIPAMMAGHLTIAGLGELVISASLVAWLQRTDLSLLLRTAPDAPAAMLPSTRAPDRLWILVAALAVLTPLGILAAGSAWGEWSIPELLDPAIHSRPALTQAPRGLQQIANIWTAPLARYAPSFVPNPSVAYAVSAIVGIAMIAAAIFGLARLLSRKHARRRSFLEKTTRSLGIVLDQALFAEDTARQSGWLQRLDPRAKLTGLGALILAAVAVHQLAPVLVLFATTILFALTSRVPLRALLGLWTAVLLFTGLIAAPSVFLIPGRILYQIPFTPLLITLEGARSAGLLLSRAETTATLSFLLVTTTVWPHLLRALRFFRVPVVVVVLLGMTYRYIFVLLKLARDLAEARTTRHVGHLAAAESRRLAAATAGVLLAKSIGVSSEVHTAMQARGFRGEVCLLDEPHMNPRDWIPLAALMLFATAIIWLGR